MTNEEMLAYVADSIRRIRLAKGFSQLDLSAAANMSQSFIANIEKGKKEPSAMTLIRIAHALEVSPRDFFPDSKDGSLASVREGIKKEIVELLEHL
jgi:transcriptional regulator with XRE-family HTH domain